MVPLSHQPSRGSQMDKFQRLQKFYEAEIDGLQADAQLDSSIMFDFQNKFHALVEQARVGVITTRVAGFRIEKLMESTFPGYMAVSSIPLWG